MKEPGAPYDLKAEDAHYTPVPNAVVERLCLLNLGAHETRIVWCIFRKTLGWAVDPQQKHLRKTVDQISLSQFQEDTGLDRRRVCEALARLKKRRVITVLVTRTRQVRTYGINFAIAEWKLSYVTRTDSRRGEKLVSRGNLPQTVLVTRTSASASDTDSASACDTDRSVLVRRTYKREKENPKEKTKECAPPARSSLSSESGKADRKERIAYLTKMRKSELFKPEELSHLFDKSLEELRQIDHARFLESNPRLALKAEAAA